MPAATLSFERDRPMPMLLHPLFQSKSVAVVSGQFSGRVVIAVQLEIEQPKKKMDVGLVWVKLLRCLILS